MVDAQFSHPRLAQVYDALDADRSDLDTYVDVVEEFGARVVLDVGCGTGSFLARLAALEETSLVGIDPAGASIDVARSKISDNRVEWIVGTMLDQTGPAWHGYFDLVTMTANVAQVFLEEEEEWHCSLGAIHTSLRPGGPLVFETRAPADRAWKRWSKELTRRVVDVPGEGPVERWVQVTGINDPFVTFESPTVFLADGERIDSNTTLRFRTEELRDSLARTGFVNIQIRDLPYAPGRGWLVLAQT